MSQESGIKKNTFELDFYYKIHRAFHDLAVQKTMELEGYSAELKELSIRWVENKKAMLADNEVGELACLIQGLQNISRSLETSRFWIDNLEEARLAAVCFSPQDAELNDLQLDWIVLLNVEEQAFHKFLSAAYELTQAIELLNANPFSADTKVASTSQRFRFRLILIATAMVNENSETAKEALKNVQSNETRWREIEEKIRGLNFNMRKVYSIKTVESTK